MPAPPTTAEKPQQQAESSPKTEKKAAASPAPAPDPIALEIEQIEQAIVEVQQSNDPIYLAKPFRRRDLIEELHERIAGLKRLQVERAKTAAEKARREALSAAWEELQPERLRICARWNAARAEIRELFMEVQQLNREHLRVSERPMLSELVDITAICRARFDLVELSPVLVRPDHL